MRSAELCLGKLQLSPIAPGDYHRIVLAKLTRQLKTDAAGPARNQDAIAGHVHGRLVEARY